MLCVCVTKGAIVLMDVIWHRLCVRHDLRNGNLFVMSLARVRRVRWGSNSSEQLICGGCVAQYFVIASCG